MHYLVAVASILALTFSSWAQYPTDYFRSPVDFPIYLAGSFAELRGNHFHSGIDIKTGGAVGKNIYAVADGYVSRIKISPYGFGKAIYIAHPNGYTSVYAHLKEFREPMATYFEKMQYRRESWALDLYLTPGQMKIEKGQVIALSGNSGSSSGPHLHFEIRETASQKPIHPQLFGFEVDDRMAPAVWWLYSYSSQGSRHAVPHEVARSNPGYRLKKADNTLKLPAGQVAFAAKIVDRMNGSGSRLGIFMAQVKADGKQVYELRAESFSFAETRYLNAHIDYYLDEVKGTRVHRLHRLPGDRLSMYRGLVNDGWIPLEKGERKEVEIVLSDVNKNTSRLSFQIEGIDPPGKSTTLSGGHVMGPGSEQQFTEQDFSITIPRTALYDTIWFQYGKDSTATLEKQFSPIFNVHDKGTPLHTHATIEISAKDYPNGLKDKTVARREVQPGKYDYYKGKWDGNDFIFKTREFGNYHLSTDTTAPSIRPLNFYNGQSVGAGQKLSLKIEDRESGIDEYDVFLNGNWLLMEYDFKDDVLFGDLPHDLQPGKHILKVRVSDDVRNISEKTFQINIKS